jgi:pyridoxine kinase
MDKENPLRKTRRMRGRELKLVQGQDLIRGTGIKDFRNMMRWDGFWDSDVETEAAA